MYLGFSFVNNGAIKLGKVVSAISDTNKLTISITNKYLCITLLLLYLNKINKNKKIKILLLSYFHLILLNNLFYMTYCKTYLYIYI